MRATTNMKDKLATASELMLIAKNRTFEAAMLQRKGNAGFLGMSCKAQTPTGRKGIASIYNSTENQV